jgi:hypothetical protein
VTLSIPYEYRPVRSGGEAAPPAAP